MGAKGAAIGSGIGAVIGLIIKLSVPDGSEALPALATTQNIETQMSMLVVIVLLSVIGGIIGTFADRIAEMF
jgi:hypothetical protein